jgi:hypothetical protein
MPFGKPRETQTMVIQLIAILSELLLLKMLKVKLNSLLWIEIFEQQKLELIALLID